MTSEGLTDEWRKPTHEPKAKLAASAPPLLERPEHEKGIRRSELFFFYALVAAMNPATDYRIRPGARPKHTGPGATLPESFNR